MGARAIGERVSGRDRTHDGEGDGVDDGLSQLLVGAVALVDHVVVALRHHH